MDIYKYAEDIDYRADYMDPHTFNIYKIQEFGNIIKHDPDTTQKIRVTDLSGQTIGFARRAD